MPSSTANDLESALGFALGPINGTREQLPSVVTIRMAGAFHQRLKNAAWRERKSMNIYAVEALLMAVKKSEQVD